MTSNEQELNIIISDIGHQSIKRNGRKWEGSLNSEKTFVASVFRVPNLM